MTGFQLESLSINNYAHTDKVSCTATFKGYGNEVRLRLPSELAHKIVSICHDEITAAMTQGFRDVMTELTNQKAEEAKQIGNATGERSEPQATEEQTPNPDSDIPY